MQPTVGPASTEVSYAEMLPHPQLHPYIYCYWELKSKSVLSEDFNYKVVSDGCIDIFFEAGNPQESFVMGFCKKYTEFPLGRTFHYVGIRFLPTIFPQFFKVNAKGLSNRFQHLSLIAPETAAFISNQFSPSFTHSQIHELFDGYFLSLLGQITFNNDRRLYDAIDTILQHAGTINVGELNTGLSARQLQRLFEFYVGCTAKTFCQVVRFQHILLANPSAQSLRQDKLFFNNYYDQAHFIKEFKTFYGVSPTKAFGR